MTPISRDEALFLAKSQSERGPILNLELVNVAGERLWQAEPSDFEALALQSDGAANANGTHVFVLGRNPQYALQILALTRKDGKEAWRHTLPREAEPGPEGMSLIADGERLIAIYQVLGDAAQRPDGIFPTENAIIGLNASSGKRLWPLGKPKAIVGSSAVHAALVAPGRLVVTRKGFEDDEPLLKASFVLDTATGETLRELPSFFVPVVTPVGLLADSLDIVKIPGADPGLGEPRILVPHRPSHQVSDALPLGIYKDLAITTFAPSPNFDGDIEIRAVDLQTGEIRWTNKVAKPSSSHGFVTTHGVFPKMIPIFEDKDTDEYAVSILNLETGERAPLESRNGAAFTVFATQERTIVLFPFERVLIAYDGETGKPCDPLTGLGSGAPHLSANSLRFGRLWYYDTDAKPSADPAWTVIDIPTWKVLHRQGQ